MDKAVFTRCNLATPVPCDLSNELDEDEFASEAPARDLTNMMDEDEFTYAGGHHRMDVQPESDNNSDRSAEHELSSEVCTRTCHCQSPPGKMPPKYTPCCLPVGAQRATREIQRFPEFRDNLLNRMGAPPKSQTICQWGEQRAFEHKRFFVEGKWIRVWRGQGHQNTIGWMLITGWDQIQVRSIDKEDCKREGRPTWTPREFKHKYLKHFLPEDNLTRFRFSLRPCREYI